MMDNDEMERRVRKLTKKVDDLERLESENRSAINTLFDRINKLKKKFRIPSSEWI